MLIGLPSAANAQQPATTGQMGKTLGEAATAQLPATTGQMGKTVEEAAKKSVNDHAKDR